MNWKAFGFPCEQNNNSNKRLLICFDSILAYLAFSCEAKHVNLTRSTFCKTITRFKAYKGRDSEIKDFIHGTVDEQHRLINFVFLKRICFKIKKGLSWLTVFPLSNASVLAFLIFCYEAVCCYHLTMLKVDSISSSLNLWVNELHGFSYIFFCLFGMVTSMSHTRIHIEL